MSGLMDSDRLSEIAKRIKDILIEFEVDAEMFTLGVRVSPKYYREIKGNFPDRHMIDIVVGHGERDWNISLICSPLNSSETEES